MQMLSALPKRLLIHRPQKRPNAMKQSCFIRKRDYGNAIVFQASPDRFKSPLRPHKMLKSLKTQYPVHGFMLKTTVNIHDIRERVKTIQINTFIDYSLSRM